MKIAMSQINTRVGDLEGNLNKILRCVRKAVSKGVDLVIFPELALTGYPPRDLLLRPSFISGQEKALARLGEKIDQEIAIIIGVVERNAGEGRPLHNAARVWVDGKWIGSYRKARLPEYDLFEESRYFEPGKSSPIFPIRGKQVGICICEDLWDRQHIGPGTTLRGQELVDRLVTAGADLLVSPCASPYEMGKELQRWEAVYSHVKRTGKPWVYVNMVGGNDEILFDGNSFAVNSKGGLIAQAKGFHEDQVIFHLEDKSIPLREPELVESIYQALVMGVRDYVLKSGFEKALVGLSGGIDSSLVACLAAEALGPENVEGWALPSRFSSPESVTDARALAEHLKIAFRVVSIDQLFQQYLDQARLELGEEWSGLAAQNLQARIRGNLLMARSNQSSSLLLATGNKSEVAVGYCTLYGDTCGGVAALGDVYKTMVYQLAGYVNRHRQVIPHPVLDKPPSAELAPGQKDQDDLPAYEILDRILHGYVEERLSFSDLVSRGFNREQVRMVIARLEKSEYKRKQLPPVLRVSRRAFGVGWRMPLARKLPAFA